MAHAHIVHLWITGLIPAQWQLRFNHTQQRIHIARSTSLHRQSHPHSNCYKCRSQQFTTVPSTYCTLKSPHPAILQAFSIPRATFKSILSKQSTTFQVIIFCRPTGFGLQYIISICNLCSSIFLNKSSFIILCCTLSSIFVKDLK
jgi:hypothetical protein